MTLLLEAEARSPGVYQISEDDWRVVPAFCGPTWSRDESWEGPRDPEGYILPVYTLGWQAIKWIEDNLLSDETDEHENPLPFRLTNEQMRFILWFYAIDENGRFLYREVVLQRLKGWGKDPLAACIAAVEFVGPCRFAGWAEVDLPEHGLEAGDPYAKPHSRAWIQCAAVSKDQNKNTFTILASIFSAECKAKHSIDVGKEIIYAYGGQKRIEAVTSSPRALEGNRPTLVIGNEPHQWLKNNEGHAMADSIERNATKAKGGAARTLWITNAYQPSEDSVGKRIREAWEHGESGDIIRTDTLYDSLEAPKSARLAPKFPDGVELSSEVKESMTRKYLSRVLEVVRGDSTWLDILSLVNSILNPRNPPSRSRRFWFNQVVAAEDVWLDPLAVDLSISKAAREARELAPRTSRGILEAGWLVAPNEPVVMFMDASKSDDSTGLVGCRISDGYIFTIGVWQKPKGERGEKWLVPREAVDIRVDEAFSRLNIVAFWGDPSHTKDDEDGSRYWDGYFDLWMSRYRDRLDPKYWPTKSGHRKHAIMFDMAGPEQQKLFVSAAEEFVESMENLNDIEEYEPTIQIDGHPALVEHFKNAIKNPTSWGTSLMKEHRESAKKIDLAVCAVGSRMLRRVVITSGMEEPEKEFGEIWGAF